jgi:hypothetical protein
VVNGVPMHVVDQDTADTTSMGRADVEPFDLRRARRVGHQSDTADGLPAPVGQQ